MSHRVLPKFKQLILGLGCGSGSLPSGTLKQALLRLDGSVTDTLAQTATSATVASPIVITTSLGAQTSIGDIVVVMGVGGVNGANGTYLATTGTDATHIGLRTLGGVNTIGVGIPSGTGMAVNLSQLQYYSQIDGCVVGTPVALANAQFVAGALSSDQVIHTGIPAGVVSAYIIYLDTGNPATSPVLYFSDCRQLLVAEATATAGSTSIISGPLEGAIPTTTSLTWSNGRQASTTSSNTPNYFVSSLAVSALANDIVIGHTVDAPFTGSTLPVTIGASGVLIIQPDPGTTYVSEPTGWFQI